MPGAPSSCDSADSPSDSTSTGATDAGATDTAAAGPRRLLLMRHAQAEGTDHEAALTAEGHGQAVDVGGALRATGLLPGRVLCSSALRARTTCDGVLRGLGTAPPVELERQVFTADADTLLDLVTMTDPGVETLLVIGHNPTMSLLAGAFLDAGAVAFPPASVAVVSLDVEWLYAAPGAGTAWLLS